MLPAALLVGTLALHACPDAPGYYCGALTRPLDSAGRVPGDVSIGFSWLPHAQTHVPSAGTIVAAEGGPGYPSGASRDGYRALFGPLLKTHDLLMMDDRGTGRSGAIDCPELQEGPLTLDGIARCAESLGPAADLYGSAAAADDLDALLGALAIPSVDLYGDSYGTFFVQVFAARHPSRVRSVVLDGAYPAIGGNPWYPDSAPAFDAGFDRVCRRAPACAVLPGSSLDRIERLLAIARQGAGPIEPAQLAFVMDSAGLDPLAYRDLDAAARAFLEFQDAVPLQRLVREAGVYEEQPPRDSAVLSNGLFVAASCSDNPQAYDMRLAPPARVAAWQRALAAERRYDPNLYAPFTLDEFLGMPLDYAYVPLCQNWPVAAPQHPAGQPIPPGAGMPGVPALVLTGDLDTITTPAEGDATAKLFRDARRVVVVNTGHVTAVGDVYACASAIVREFIARRPVDTRCADRIPPMRLVPVFARSLAGVPAATATAAGERSGDLRLAADATAAAGDALARVIDLGMTRGSGLRGGTVIARSDGDATWVSLEDVKWTEDLAVSGEVAFDSRSGAADARLHCGDAALHVTWRAYSAAARATIDGTVAGRTIRATMPAP
jgi:pimeloyl-ACP methyl ester carboxylesterase